MSHLKQSDSFKLNFFFWIIFGLWPGRVSKKYYKYYSFFYLFITLIIYNLLLTLNLFYTPRNIESLIREVIFYFTEVAVTAKVLMILVMREEILRAFEILDSTTFAGDGDDDKTIIRKYNDYYKTYWKCYAAISNFAYSSQVLLPLIVHVFKGAEMELPICKYYFLTDLYRQKYFSFWYLYQSTCMYGHMMYNVNVDSFIAGLIMLGIAQFKSVHIKLENIKSDAKDTIAKELNLMRKLNACLLHYDLLLRYCDTLQRIFNVTMFVQFGAASAIICVVLCGLLLPSSTETYLFLVSYLFAMTLQIFVPGWLGTQLSYESHDLTNAAYKTDWIPRSERFKRSLRLLVQRTNKPIILTGLKMFPLSLGSFTAIMKSAYSFFTLVRNVQDRQAGTA